MHKSDQEIEDFYSSLDNNGRRLMGLIVRRTELALKNPNLGLVASEKLLAENNFVVEATKAVKLRLSCDISIAHSLVKKYLNKKES